MLLKGLYKQGTDILYPLKNIYHLSKTLVEVRLKRESCFVATKMILNYIVDHLTVVVFRLYIDNQHFHFSHTILLLFSLVFGTYKWVWAFSCQKTLPQEHTHMRNEK